MAQLDVRIVDCRPDAEDGEPYADRQFIDAAALCDAQPLQSLLTAAGIPPAQHTQWEALDVETEVIDDQRLLQLRQLPCSLVNLRRLAGAGEKRAAGTATSHGGKVARSSGAGAASSAGAASREPPAGYAAEAWPCAEGENRIQELGSSVPLLNALLELVDNAIRALLARRAKEPSSPLEIRIHVWQEGGVWLLSVRDTGIGMDTSHIPDWGRLHVSEAITRLHADGTPARGLEEGASDNPFYGSGLLHFAGLGGKSAAMAASAHDGYADVLSLGLGAGNVVANLQLHKNVARERQLAVRVRQLVPREERAALPPLRDVQALPGGVRPANAVERGERQAPDGGWWQGAGTQVTVTRLNEAMVHLVGDAASQAKVRRLLAHVYHSYIHPREAAHLEVGAPPGSRTAAADADVDLPPPIKIVAFGVDLVTVSDDLTSRILTAGAIGQEKVESPVFRLSVALVRPDGEVSHIGARIFYNPCVDGRPTRPEDALVAAGILSPTQLIVLRTGRVLTNNDMPATVTVPQLRASWGSDTQAMKKRARETCRFLARCTGFVAVGPSSQAKSDKTRLNEDSMHFAALAAIFSSSEVDAHEKLAVPNLRGVRMFMLPFREDGSCNATAGWQPFNLVAVRNALINFVQTQHDGRDSEAGPFAPPGSLPWDLQVSNAEERERLKCPDACRLTGWLGVLLPGGPFPQRDAKKEMRLSLTIPDARRGRTAAGLYTLRCFVTLGSADDDESRITTGQVVLDPWNATEEGRSQLLPIAGAIAAGVNGGRWVMPMRLALNKAVVLPISVLTESAYSFRELEQHEWNRLVEDKSKALPSRLFVVTNFLPRNEPNCLVDRFQLEHDMPLTAEWCITILNVTKAATELEPGAAIKPSHMFVSDARLTLTVSRADGTGGALETFTKDTHQRRGNDAVSKFGINNGRGLYLFESADLRSLQRPGDYVLTFSVAGNQVDDIELEPLVLRITRKRAPLKRVLDANAEWSVCCHPGACVPGLPRCVQGRLGAALGATVGSDEGVDTTLYLSQKDSNGNDLGFPSDAWRSLKLSIWDTTDETEHDGSGRKQRQLEMIKLPMVRIGDVRVSECGKDLEIRNVKLLRCALPTGADLDDDNRTGPGSRGKQPSAPLQTLLRIGIDAARVEREGNTIKLLGGCECPLTIFPGHARRIAVSPGEDSLQGLISGALLPQLAISLLDSSGNTTVSPAGAEQLSMTLYGLALANQLDTPAESIVPLSREGTARLRLMVTALPGAPFSLELKVPGLQPAKLSGVAAQREVRLCLSDDPEQLADATLAGEAGAPLAALGNVFAHVCLPGATEPDTEFGGRLFMHATGAPAPWCAHVAGLLLQAAQGRAQLPPTLALPLASCRVTLYVLPEKRTGAASAPPPAHAARIEIEVTAPPLARLEARAAEEEAMRGSDVRLVLIALAESGAQVPVPQELLMALLPSDPAVELRSAEPLGDGSAAVTVRVDAAPGTYPVFLSAPPSADGSRPAASVTWQVSLVAGAPELAEFTLRGAAADADGGAFRVARGDAVPFVANFVDDDGAECAASATDGCMLRLTHAEDASWLIPDTCKGEWCARDNSVTLEGLAVSPEAPLGAHVIAMQLFSAPRGGSRRKGGSSQQKPMLQLELRLRVVAGTRPAALLLSHAGPLVVEAGAALLHLGVISVMDASDQLVPASAVAAQHLTLEVRGNNPSAPMDPRKVRSSAKVYAAPGIAGGGFDCAAATPALRAPDLAGMYHLVFSLDNAAPGGTPLVLQRALTVIGAASGQLTCKFKSPVEQLPSCVEDGAAPGQSTLFADRLDIVFLDRFGNAVDLSAAMPQRGVRLRFERAAPAPGLPPLPQPVKAEAVEEAAAAAAKEGRVSFTQLLAVPHWPSGEYRLVVEPRPEWWMLPRAPDSVLSGDAVHAFQYLDATAAQDERERARRARDAETAALAAATALREARDDATRAAAASQSAAAIAAAAQATAASTAAAEQAARAAAQAASAAGATAEQRIAEIRAERDSPPPSDDGTPPPPVPLHIDAFRAALNRRRGGGSLGAARASEGGLGASFAGRADVLGPLSDLLRAETPAVGDALARAVGNAALGTVLVRNATGRDRCVECLPPTLQLLRLDHPAAQARFWRGAVEATGQRALSLPALPYVPGLLGYCVNLVHLSEQHLQAVVEAGPAAPAAGAAAGRRGATTSPPVPPPRLGLRESVLYYFFGTRVLFETDGDMHAFAQAHPLGPSCVGLRSLEGGAVEDCGCLERGAEGERPFEQPRQATPWDRVEAAPLLPSLRAALRAARETREAQAHLAVATRDAADAAAAAQAAQTALHHAQAQEASCDEALLAAAQLSELRRAQADAFKGRGASAAAAGPSNAGRADARRSRRST